MPPNRTTPPTPAALDKLATTVQDAALHTVEREYILVDAPRLSGSIRAVVAVIPAARFVNNRTLLDALLTANSRARGDNNNHRNLWHYAAVNATEEAGARQEVTSWRPFATCWLRVADVLDDLTFAIARRDNAARRKKTPAPTEADQA